MSFFGLAEFMGGKFSEFLSAYYTTYVFVSQERVSGFPEKGADLRGSLGNFRTSGEVWETSGEPLDCC